MLQIKRKINQEIIIEFYPATKRPLWTSKKTSGALFFNPVLHGAIDW